jgi:hypothetical protein
MRTYENLVELARMCARQAWLSSTPQVAGELWRMAKEYQAKAASMMLPPHWTSATRRHGAPRLKPALTIWRCSIDGDGRRS